MASSFFEVIDESYMSKANYLLDDFWLVESSCWFEYNHTPHRTNNQEIDSCQQSIVYSDGAVKKDHGCQ